MKTKTKKINYTPLYDTDISIPITKSGAFIKFSLLDDRKTIRKIENYFTLKHMNQFGTLQQMKRCRVDKKNSRIIVPRFGVFEISKHVPNINIKSQIKPGNDIKLEWKISLYPNQKIITDYIKKNVYNKRRVSCGSSGCILNLEAGQGKTYVATYFMGLFQKKTAVILHSTSMLVDWERAIKTSFGDIEIGYYYNKRKKDGDIMLIIINSAIKDTFVINGETILSSDFYNQFGFIVMDECHLYANKTSGKIFDRGQARYMLGLSATPDENAMGFDKAVWWGLGEVINAVDIKGYVSTENTFTAEVNRIMYYGPAKYTKLLKNDKTDLFDNAGTINMICKDEKRTNLIIDCIIECVNKNLNTFVFADRREYLLQLIGLLTSRRNDISSDILTDDMDFKRIVGGTTEEELKHASVNSKVIFTTYQYMGTGKSIIRMNGLVMATPRKSKMKQYVKRIFRLGSDMSIKRVIYDIVDMRLNFKNQWSTRKKFYTENNFEIIERKVK